MKVKTAEEMLNKGLSIACGNPHGRVVFVFTSPAAAKASFEQCLKLADEVITHVNFATREISVVGGSVRFLVVPIDADIWHIGGWQFSHVFEMEHMSPIQKYGVKSRIRGKTLQEPTGYYTKYGVERIEDY